MKKLLALVLVAVMTLGMFACTPKDNDADIINSVPLAEKKSIVGKSFGAKDPDTGLYPADADYTATYDKFGKEVTLDEVVEDAETGLAYIVKDGVRYELGLDFLTMAMVYNAVPTDEYPTADDAYAAWWRLYIQRWNYLLPEIPLYSNEYYDLYNAKIKGVQENPTNPYWGPADALIDWTSEKDNTIIIGSSTDLSGKFRYASFGVSSPGSADLDIESLTTGLATVTTTKEGGYVWNDTVVKSHTETENADGSKTFTIEIYDDLKFSDGSPINAKHYLVRALVFSSPVAAAATGSSATAGMSFVGYKAFNEYDGTTGTKEFTGLRLLGDYQFSVTIDPQYLPYFYDVTYASFSPNWIPMWAGNAEVKDDGNGAYLTSEFYAKSGDKYTMVDTLVATSQNTDTTYPYSGPYVVKSYDAADKSAVLEANPNFKGNYEGTKPQIAKVVYKKIVPTTQIEDLKAGNLDVIAGITGGAETDEAISLADGSNGAYAYVHYSRAGYGKLGFRADFGPTQFVAVRQAVALCMDREMFAKDFTGGYGGAVNGPYYTGSWMYKKALEQGMTLDVYPTSADAAIEVLEAGGWVYNAEGGAYTSGVRYKQIPAAEMQDKDKTFQSKDGTYKVTQVGDYYYMPLVLNWYGTTDNPFTDQLMTGFLNNDNIAAAGIVVQNNIGEFNPMLDELYQEAVYGFYAGTPMYNCFNFATGFTSSVYDYSYNMTIDPSMYDQYSAYYIKDDGDIYWLTDADKGLAPADTTAAE
ncbi:MAG: hypothetical protein IJX53_08205 [Clostridia bacterium]|nr:hypothetical protein [Clostridia bacterium]